MVDGVSGLLRRRVVAPRLPVRLAGSPISSVIPKAQQTAERVVFDRNGVPQRLTVAKGKLGPKNILQEHLFNKKVQRGNLKLRTI